MNRATLIAFLSLISLAANSQISKGNWLVGGNFNYSNSKSSGSASSNSKFREITIMPTAGYFIFDKGAVGLKSKLTFTNESYNLPNGTEISNSQNLLGVGPFLKDYFLPTENKINAFGDGSILYKQNVSKVLGNTTISKFKTLDYSLACGMVIFLNTSVGVEFSVGYYSSKAIDFNAKEEDFKFGISFQIHLEKQNA